MIPVKMKIRPQFLPLIRNKIKLNEYRLASPKYSNIHVGDVIYLINNQNTNDYVRVVVDKIDKYKSWDEAFSGRWKNDFKGLYASYNDLLKECYKFYTRREVEQYGIEVFKIQLISDKKIKNAKYLFDTNIIVQRESITNTNDSTAIMFKLIEKIGGKQFYHPLTKEELSNYADEKVKNAMLNKLNAYDELIPSIDCNEDFEKVCNNYKNDDNSKIDNQILLQAYNGRVDFLITEDRAILKKANDLLIRDCVLTCDELIRKIEDENPSLIDYDVLSVKLKKIGNLNFNDKFFDSLREDYEGSKFNNWLERKSNEDAYVFENKDGLQGFLYLKTEDETNDYSNFEPVFEPKKRLKVGTFKINSTGIRLGERFLKIIFDNALKRNVDEIYVTLFEDKRQEVKNLMYLMQQWGFVKKAIKKDNGEAVLVKDMRQYDYSKNPKFNYPLYYNKKIGILPIYSSYHTKLFPDLHLNNENMELYNEACSYAIEKIYVCNSQNIKLKPGDLLCIYRMAEYNKKYRSVVSGVSILSEIIYPNSLDEYLKICKNRSVFSEDELKKFYITNNYRTVIKLLFLKPFDKKVNLNDLYENDIIDQSKGPRISTFISEDNFIKLEKLGLEEN